MFKLLKNKFIYASALQLILGANFVFADEINYKIKLRSDQGSNLGRCAVNVSIEGLGNVDVIAVAPDYLVNFNLPSKFEYNHLVKVKGKIKWGLPPNNAPACTVDGEIYINQLILDEWMPLKVKYRESPILNCIDLGVKRLNESIDGPANNEKLYLRLSNAKATKILNACDQLLLKPPRKEVSCDINGGQIKSICNEGYYNPKDKDYELNLENALYALLDGKEIRVGLWETKDARASRIDKKQKEDEQRQAQEQERSRLTKEREDREKWLQTPEGKKFRAEEEAKSRRAEEERQKLEAAQRAKMAIDFPFIARITCTINGQHTNTYACFGGRVGTEIELKNGTDYGLYKVYQLESIGNETRDGFIIDLRKNFSIKAQNSHDNFILGLKIFDRKTNALIYEKQVPLYGVISIKN